MSLLRLLGWSKNRLKRHDKRLRARVRKGVEMPKFKKRQCTKTRGECCYCDKVKCCFCAQPGEPAGNRATVMTYDEYLQSLGYPNTLRFGSSEPNQSNPPREGDTFIYNWQSISWDLETMKEIPQPKPIDDFNDDGSEEDHTE